jgi:hypothetical protein
MIWRIAMSNSSGESPCDELEADGVQESRPLQMAMRREERTRYFVIGDSIAIRWARR